MALKVGALYASFDIDAKDLDRQIGGIELGLGGLARTISALGIGKMLLDAAKGSAEAAIEFESAFAGVRKTVNATESEFKELSDGIKELATAIPKTTTELAGIMEMGGQLGVPTENLREFTEVISALDVATNLTQESAASMFAQFANITKMDYGDFDRLGSVVVDLGNNFATTENDIMQMAMRLAGAGSTLGMTEADIIAFATSLSSMGIAAESGGSAFSRLMIKMKVAADTGTKANEIIESTGLSLRELELLADQNSAGFKDVAAGLDLTSAELKKLMGNAADLEAFAEVTGQTADEFARAFSEDSTGQILAFLQGIERIEESGGSAIVTLDEMGITEIRLRDAILRASHATDVFTTANEMASTAWDENLALTKEAEQRYETTRSKMTMLKNAFNNVAIELGNKLTPAINLFADAGISVLNWLRDVIDNTNNTVLSMKELETVVSNFSMPATMSMDNIATARDNVADLAEKFGELTNIIGKETLKVKLGATIEGAELNTFAALIDDYIRTGIATIEAQQYTTNITLAAALGEGATYEQLSQELFAPFFAQVEQDAGNAGREARNALVSAMADGRIAPEEAAKIQALASAYNAEVARAIANNELQGTLLQIRMEADEGLLKHGDIQKIVDTTFKHVKAALETAKQSQEEIITLAYRAAAALELDEAQTRKYIDSLNRDMLAMLSNIGLEGLNNVFNTLNDQLMLPDPAGVFDDYAHLIDQGVIGLADAIYYSSYSLQDSASSLWMALEPNVEELRSIKKKYEEAGYELPQSLIDGLNKAELLESLADGAYGLAWYMADRFGKSIDDLTPYTKAELEHMLSEVADVLYTDVAIPDAMSAMWDDVFSTSLAAIDGKYRDQLEAELRALGIDVGQLLGVALPEGIAAGLNRGETHVREAAAEIAKTATSTQSDVQASVNENITSGEEIGGALATGQDNAKEGVGAAAQGLADAVAQPMIDLKEVVATAADETVAAIETEITAGEGSVVAAMDSLTTAVVNEAIMQMSAETGADIGNTFVHAIIAAILALKATAKAAGSALASEVKAVTEGILSYPAGQSIGYQFDQGIAQGIRNGISLITSAARSAASAALDAAKGVLGISSPSRVGRDEIGLMYPKGIALGVLDGIGYIADASKHISEILLNDMYVGDPSRGTVYSSGKTVRQTAQQTAQATEQQASGLDRARAIGLSIAQALIESGALDSDVYMDGDKVGEKVATPVSKNIDRKTKSTISGRSAKAVLA